MPETDQALIAVRPCGCVTAAMVVGYATKREEVAEVKRWMKQGNTVEQTTVGEARQRQNFLGDCPHGTTYDEPAQTAKEVVEAARA